MSINVGNVNYSMPSVYTSATGKADSASAVSQNQTAVQNEETLQSVSDSVNFSSSERISKATFKPEKTPASSPKKSGTIPNKYFGGDVSRAESVAD
ncbi:hypothetical protein IJJ97_03325, partial [bacterium]|nr:hypothetical protein [bacterium]